uniref:Zona pellucida sperm-binding protein 4 n=1 Tax=Leptobrachium leishanense TaxID=445787 RepID=A0A8C5PPP9_9ANUR
MVGLWLLFQYVVAVRSFEAGLQYVCGQEGVQLRVSPDYMAEDVTFQVRDEFGMGYSLMGCLASCLFSSRDTNGESVFYSPYSVCLSTLKVSLLQREETCDVRHLGLEVHGPRNVFEDGVWKLRVRLIGIQKTQDLVLICPKPKTAHPKVLVRTPKTLINTSMSTMSSDLAVPTNETVDGFQVTEEAVTSSGIVPSIHLKPSSISTTETGYTGILSPEQCLVPLERVSCMDYTSRDECLHSRCCYDPQDSLTPCYHGHTVSLQCHSDGRFRLVISRHVTHPPLLLASVVLGPQTCPAPTLENDQFLEFKGHLGQCATHRFSEGKLVYELLLKASQNVLFLPMGSITRDASFRLLSWCTYPSSVFPSLVSIVVSAVPIASVSKISGLSLQLRISRDSSYTSFFSPTDFPLRILLGNPIFLEVRLLHPYDPRLHLRLHNCWGAPTLDPEAPTQWPLIHNGCPFVGDDKITQLLAIPYPSNLQRFTVSAFTFLGHPNKTQVYFFCSVSVCLPSVSDTCISSCNSLSRSQRSQAVVSLHLVNSFGPLIVQPEMKHTSTSSKSHNAIHLCLTVFCVLSLFVLLV